ncbi:MAG: hypothetical protein H6832_18440 [Planctomycetes bacterium]|nr:hypothetical protein [Planctomycetota bacterium]MCB9920387.1 hypothetical protein [Planctomycetota bacterium]
MAAFVSCGGTPETVAGSWTLDTESFVDAAIPVMVDAGRIPAGAERLAEAELTKVRMQIDLRTDGTFVCDMGIGATARYEGTWLQNGQNISLVQTLENGESKDDQMSGKCSGDFLRLVHDEQGMSMPYVLRRNAAASPR